MLLSRNRAGFGKIRALASQARRFASISAKRQAAVLSSHTSTPARSADSWTNANPSSEFTVSPKTGFLPRHDPLQVLPSYFEKLEEILDEMPIYKGDGTYGLLHSGRFGERVERELPLYDVDFIFDNRILSALYRDYTFLASAYLLEPCDIQYRLAQNYGLARRVLPANIAKPLATIAARLNARPYLEHSMSFTFYNYKRKDSSAPLSVDNMEPIRRFSGCMAENSYIVGHVAAAQQTGSMVDSALALLASVRADTRQVFDQALQSYAKSMVQVNGILSNTLKNTSEYASFRTYLSGCKSQPMFNNGVMYESVVGMSGDSQYFGVAQSSNPIASLNTHLFQLSSLSPQGTLPCSDGIDNLRPENYRAFFTHINAHSSQQHIQSYALKSPVSSSHYVSVLSQVLAYRYRQWANLRDSFHLHTLRSSPEFRTYLDVQTRHIRDIAELIQRTRSNTDLEMLTPAQRASTDNFAHKAESVRRSLSRVIQDVEPGPLPTSMIAY